jgi:hypothetical protein
VNGRGRMVTGRPILNLENRAMLGASVFIEHHRALSEVGPGDVAILKTTWCCVGGPAQDEIHVAVFIDIDEGRRAELFHFDPSEGILPNVLPHLRERRELPGLVPFIPKVLDTPLVGPHDEVLSIGSPITQAAASRGDGQGA